MREQPGPREHGAALKATASTSPEGRIARGALLLGAGLLAGGQGVGAAPPPAAPPVSLEAEGPSPTPETEAGYRIGAGDVLRVTVYGHEDLSQTVVVQPTGGFVYPLLGTVAAAGWTPQEVEGWLRTRLAKGLIREPRVSVTVQEFRSQVVHVMGEVTRPGTYPLTGHTTIVEVLARAGPLSPQAGSEIVVLRARPGAGPAETAASAAVVLKVDLLAIRAGRLQGNIALAPDDTVFVPEAERVYVTGEVRNPGAFPYRAGLTVRQAVSLAGGFSEDAATGSANVVRATADGKSRTSKIKLDDPLRPGDTVTIKAKLF